ncbi:hypothetical protein CANARDRAFT_8000 [[Candida] arabinofermentans NRRL YB-2248]|uniref:ER membrane protein complex subunit 6 n=1 Tax=[Candida] arabinofermentans NRRL YB-2248 TaxID=983967 RepID=A0A1E4SZH8_9ASCO|nr:hypothetical protein CANARDRAFT_8000 [[Candida] arabinofermentans NRRL YB-2248]
MAKIEKKKKPERFSKPIRFELSSKYNKQLITKVKDITSLSFGACCGILNLTSINGFIFFIITNIITSIAFYLIHLSLFKKNSVKLYYENPLSDIFLNDIGRYLASFTMMWCLLFALVST